MGLFSLDNILVPTSTKTVGLRESTVIDIDNIGYVDKDVEAHSFIQEGYDAILEMNAMYCNAEKEFYTRILGSYGDDKIINEGFSNFFDSIKKIIKKFIEWIKKVFKEFAAKLAALVGSEKYIKKHKDLFNKFSSEDEFEYQGYKFTHVTEDDYPKSDAVEVFATDASGSAVASVLDFSAAKADGGFFDKNMDTDYYNSDAITNKDTWTDADTEDIRTARKTATDNFNNAIDKARIAVNDNASDFRDKFRAYVIGKENETIDSSDFSEELFELFRDGENSTSSITIDYNFVQDAYRRFDKYKEVTKVIEKKKNEMIKDYEDLEKHLDKMIKYNESNHKIDYSDSASRSYTSSMLGLINKPSGFIYDKSTADKMQSLLKAYSVRVNDMCQIHTQAFSAKLEACKDCFKQDKTILNKAIQHILKRSNKEDF